MTNLPLKSTKTDGALELESKVENLTFREVEVKSVLLSLAESMAHGCSDWDRDCCCSLADS